MIFQMGFRSESHWQTIMYLVSSMSSSIREIVVNSETRDTKGSPWSNPEQVFGWHTQQQDKFAKETIVWEMWNKTKSNIVI